MLCKKSGARMHRPSEIRAFRTLSAVHPRTPPLPLDRRCLAILGRTGAGKSTVAASLLTRDAAIKPHAAYFCQACDRWGAGGWLAAVRVGSVGVVRRR